MICKECNVRMIPGTRYEEKDGKKVIRRYDECPKCHFRKYNNGKNNQGKVEYVNNKNT